MADINQVEKTDYSALKLSYVDKDYTNILDDLINSIPGITTKWDTTDANDPGLILVKLMAMLGDMLFYTQDMQSLEVYPSSVTQRKNANSIYKLIGYKMRWYKSATLEADVVNTYSQAATIPRYCTFTTADSSITYTTVKPYDVPSNTLNNGALTTIELVQGVPVTPNKISSNPYPQYNYTTDDIIDNRIYLGDNNIDQEHIVMYDDQGEEWTLKDNIYTTRDVGKFFEFGVDSNDNTYIELIDYYVNYNVSKFKIFYILSNGEDGQINGKALTNLTGNVWSRVVVEDTINLQNVSGFIEFVNYASTKGYNPETPDEARKNSAYYVNTMDTIITLADFERAVLREPGVANVRATDLTNDPGKTMTYYLGDINQDGKINYEDYNLLLDYTENPVLHPLKDFQLRLADVNQDGTVDKNDLACIKAFIDPDMYKVGDINMDGVVNSTDVTILQNYLNGSSTESLTDFQLRLADFNQDGEVTENDLAELRAWVNASQKPYVLPEICDNTLAGETGLQTLSTVKLLDSFVVKLYVARTDEYEQLGEQDDTFDDLYITGIQEALRQYKILPLTIDIDLHSIGKYFWTIKGTFLTKEPLGKDELQTIIININNLLNYKYSSSKVNFNKLPSYREILDDILSVDSRILMVDLEPLTFFDNEQNPVTKQEITGSRKREIPLIPFMGNITRDDKLIDNRDLELLDKYLNGEVELTEEQLLYADINYDGVVDRTDYDLLEQIIENLYGSEWEDRNLTVYDITLLDVPILPGSLIISVNEGEYTLKDNGNGSILNVDGILSKTGSIDYTDGTLHLEFNDDILTENLIITYTKNVANLAVYSNLSTQTFTYDSSSLKLNDVDSIF